MWVTDQKGLAETGVAYYQNLFRSEQPSYDYTLIQKYIPQLITNDQNSILIRVPNEDEIKSAVHSMNPEEAAGPDGFGGVFYIACWEIIKSDLIAAVQSFFYGQSLPRTWTSTLLVMVPKVASPITFGDLRPISLCTYSAKIISKILADRMAIFLPSIISLEQSGFIKGRNITENILLAQELLHKIDSKVRGNNVMLKLDMAKAYDRMSWLFILKSLRQFGFDERFVDMVRRLLSNN